MQKKIVQLQESCKKASIICPESEIEALGDWDGSTPEQLSAQLDRLNQRLRHENQQYGWCLFLTASSSGTFVLYSMPLDMQML